MVSLDMNRVADFRKVFLERIESKQEEIHNWLLTYEKSEELPLYTSVDIRDAGFKVAVVDTNLFPAGFNNLCEHGIDDSVHHIRQAILRRMPECKNILIIAEEHTRNTWYLENIRILQQIITKAGFNSKIATFLNVQPAFCENAQYVELQTATGQSVRVYCLRKIISGYKNDKARHDLIIMNNDLTTGIPDVLKEAKIPIYPSIQAGWHSRQKSHHFDHTRDLMREFAEILEIDPWLFSTEYSLAESININVDSDRTRLADVVSDLYKHIGKKYQEHNIDEKPFVFLKADSGTYGMGVLPIEDPSDILQLNRKNRNRLYKGKSAQVIDRFLVQEGVPTIYSINQKVSEVCIYQIDNNLIGGFYRSHPGKTSRDNLNSKGMDFNQMCPHSSKYGDCGIHHDVNIFDVYRILARIAGIAAHREIVQLEGAIK